MKMKNTALVCAAIVSFALIAPQAPASRFDSQYETHPLKVLGYGFHAVGQGLSWVIFRPIHWLVSQDNMDVVFGHKAHATEEDTHFIWEHGDYSPSIARERAERGAVTSGASSAASTRPTAKK
jgi:hypothetical protein